MDAEPLMLRAALHARAGDFVLDATLACDAAAPLALFGRNGSGKTTALRAIAGLLPLDGGSVRLGDELLEDAASGVRLAPQARRIGLVFQEPRLFPHRSLRANVAFGPRAHGRSVADARRAADLWLDRVGLSALGSRRPAGLSGGEARRVAWARALASEPRLLLLDEPFAGIDAPGRAELRRLLRETLAGFAGPVVLVTHDPLDARALGARAAVLEAGRVAQEGSIEDLARRPRTRFVADLVGTNLLRGRASGHRLLIPGGAEIVCADEASGDALAVVPPRAVALHRAAPEGSPRNVWRVQVESVEPLGDRVRVALRGAIELAAEVTPEAVADLALAPGLEVWASVKATEVEVAPA